MVHAFIFLSLSLAHPGAPTKTAKPLVGYNLPDAQLACVKIQGYYNKISTFRASFKQVFTKRFHGAQKPEKGILFIKKPGKMYWEYQKPEKKYFIIDGKRAWVYEPASKQALWKNIQDSSLPTPVKFLWGKGNLVAEFNIKLIPRSKFGGKGLTVLKLVPKKRSPHYRSVLFVHNTKGAVVSSIVYDHDGNKNQITFSNMKLNTKIPDSRFSFKPPKGVQVLQASGKPEKPARK